MFLFKKNAETRMVFFPALRALRYRHRGTIRSLSLTAAGVAAVGAGGVALSQAVGVAPRGARAGHSYYFDDDEEGGREGGGGLVSRAISSVWDMTLGLFSGEVAGPTSLTSFSSSSAPLSSTPRFGGGEPEWQQSSDHVRNHDLVSGSASEAYSRPRRRPSRNYSSAAPVVSDLDMIIALHKRGDLSDDEVRIFFLAHRSDIYIVYNS